MKAIVLALLLACSTVFSFDVFLCDQNSNNQFLVMFVPMKGYPNPDPWGSGIYTPSTVAFPEPVWAGKMIATRTGFVPDTIDTVLHTSTNLQIVYFDLRAIPTSVKVPAKIVRQSAVNNVYYDISGRRVVNNGAAKVAVSKARTIVILHNHRCW